eukprot:CAMPEP_0194749950 /NCGR_PEP_ID=MMETSP0323_2-20130528/3997_1 /TAXON_ID=2866 ORGANISM="Crypthecodinium cohnii, Strain Seligo" /NCGR_SAMPLE_ID=MMETSP0323_2 /ASSEMBLY_ACC=CAM_ASM_000346 /LENGTH=58 /DNA_ID=CAMNT_0039665269 /DNA_START=525 /DNA_END=701 /DNA_ORIENTATION=+
MAAFRVTAALALVMQAIFRIWMLVGTVKPAEMMNSTAKDGAAALQVRSTLAIDIQNLS